MLGNNTDAAERTLQQSRIHEEWVDNYRALENENFYVLAFDY